MPSAESNGHRTIHGPQYYYDLMPPEQRKCRGKRMHDFPEIDPDEESVPEGVRITGLGRQNYLITKECSRGCGMVLVEYTRWTSRHFKPTRRPGYLRPEDWVTVPRGVLSPSDIRQRTMDRAHDIIVKFAQKPEEIPA